MTLTNKFNCLCVHHQTSGFYKLLKKSYPSMNNKVLTLRKWKKSYSSLGHHHHHHQDPRVSVLSILSLKQLGVEFSHFTTNIITWTWANQPNDVGHYTMLYACVPLITCFCINRIHRTPSTILFIKTFIFCSFYLKLSRDKRTERYTESGMGHGISNRNNDQRTK